MNRKLRIALQALGAILLIAVVLFYPYNAGSVPQWKLQIVDQTGKPVVGGAGRTGMARPHQRRADNA
jgi:hypothetical protein